MNHFRNLDPLPLLLFAHNLKDFKILFSCQQYGTQKLFIVSDASVSDIWTWKLNLCRGRKGGFLFPYKDHRSSCTTHRQESVNLSVNVLSDLFVSMADLIDTDRVAPEP